MRDIAESLVDLQFTKVWEIKIDRSKQPSLPDPLSLIMKWSDFIYHYNVADECDGFFVREQSFLGNGTFIPLENFKKLWANGIICTTGAELNNPLGNTDIVRKEDKEAPKSKKQANTTKQQQPSQVLANPQVCDRCGQFILRKGNMPAHTDSCNKKWVIEQARREYKKQQIALARVRSNPINLLEELRGKNGMPIAVSIGFARKIHKKKCARFTEDQKDIMIHLFSLGEQPGGTKWSPEAAHQYMIEQLGDDDALQPEQIKSWWSTYHRKRRLELLDKTPAKSKRATETVSYIIVY